MRLNKEQLNKVKDKYGVDELYSWSKINCFLTSPYEYFLNYILHKKEDNANCAYAPLGSIIHQVIEDYYNGKIKYENMIEQFKDGWITIIDIADLKFDRNDDDKNNNIKEKYKEDLFHFFNNHNVIKNKIITEQFIATKIGDYVLQGYADAIYKDKEGNYNIIDWKSSSEYKGKTLEEHSGQLCVYAIGLMQLGVPVEKIKICFNFLKYCTVEVTQKNGKKKERSIERCKLGESLCSNAKMWLKEYGYNENEIDEYIKEMIGINSVDNLPFEVKNKFTISDRYVYIDFTKKLIEKWTNLIIATIKDIKDRENDYKETYNEKCFWDTEDSIKKNSFYFSTLCGYSRNLLKPYNEYCNKIEEKNNSIFEGVGSCFENKKESTNNNYKKFNKDEIDLSWLDDII